MDQVGEEEAWQRWLKMHEAAQVLAQRAGTAGEFETPPRTIMAGDDEYLGAYHLTTARRCASALPLITSTG